MSDMVVKNKRPFGFYVCSVAFMFERMAYYAAKYLIYVFVAATVVTGGLGLTSVEAALIQSNLVAFTYLAPIIGGYISDRFIGARYCVPVGIALMAAGYWIGASATDAVGILVASTFAQGEVQGFRAAFQLCAVICVVDLIWFLFGSKSLGEVGKKPFKLGKEAEKDVVVENKPLTKSEKKKVFAIILISTFSVIFWVFWYLTYLAAYDYGAAFINMNVSGFNVPLSWFDSLNSMTCIALGPVLGMLWFKLSKTAKGDLSLFKKLGIGLGLLGAAFLMLVFAEFSRGVGASDASKASLFWLIAFGLLLSVGEMFFSPLGNSFVAKYAPNKMLSVLMGVWTLSSFVAGKSYGYLYAIVSKVSVIQAYSVIPAILFVAAVMLFVFDKKLTTLLEDESDDVEDALGA